MRSELLLDKGKVLAFTSNYLPNISVVYPNSSELEIEVLPDTEENRFLEGMLFNDYYPTFDIITEDGIFKTVRITKRDTFIFKEYVKHTYILTFDAFITDEDIYKIKNRQQKIEYIDG
jgi:hypothetical protein